MKITYGWKTGYFKVDAQKVGKELESLSTITPETILKKAKNKKSVLHPCFEWDETKAAHKYRLQQAREVINDLEITIVKSISNKQQSIEFVMPAYENIQMDKGRQYVLITEGMQDSATRSKIFDEIKSLLQQAQNKLDKYNEYVNLLLS